jgi:phosphoadenosine phosphosulfate reductase
MQADISNQLLEVQAQLQAKTEVEGLRFLADTFVGKVVFSTSLGYEDQVITDMVLGQGLGIEIFTLDTGRLFNETYLTLHKTNTRYNTTIRVYAPRTEAVEELVSSKGPMSFYESVENRKECCYIRKVEPLNRALAGAKVWVTGIRAEQSNNRQAMTPLEWDSERQLYKFHPLLDWSLDDVKTYLTTHRVPYNPLHDKGFVSIGCAPCTRAIQPGEDFRAGRWWWEDENKKECGLHSR